jgi:lipoprotein NlpD
MVWSMKILSRIAVVVASVLVVACTATTPAPIVDRTSKPAPAAGPSAAQPSAVKPTTRVERPEFYAVRPGDTFTSIANANGVDRRELQALNNLSDANRLSVGQILRLRPAGSVPTPAPVVAVVPPVPQPVAPPPEPEIQVNPIAGRGVIEARPLDATPARPLDPPSTPLPSGAPTTPSTPDQAPSSAAVAVKTEPRPFKLPYSDENLALVRRNDLATNRPPGAPSVSTPAPATSAVPAPVQSPAPAPVQTPAPIQTPTPVPIPSPPSPAAATAAPPPPAVAGAPASVERDGVNWSWPVNGKVMQESTLAARLVIRCLPPPRGV